MSSAPIADMNRRTETNTSTDKHTSNVGEKSREAEGALYCNILLIKQQFLWRA